MNLITAKVDDFENVREGVPGSSLVGGGYVRCDDVVLMDRSLRCLEHSAFLHKNLAIWSWLLIQDPLNVGNRQGLGFEGLPIVGVFVALRIWRSWS